MTLDRFLIRMAVSTFQKLRRCIWFVTRPEVRGVSAVALDAHGNVIMVRLTYAKGWDLPGGGQKKSETPRHAVLRELREEIGMSGFAEILEIGEFTHRPDYRRGTGTLFLLKGVAFTPRRSLEIDAIAAFAPEALPVDTKPLARKNVARALSNAKEAG